jgi:hypothetical protein
MAKWQPPTKGTNDITLDEWQLKELSIIKQAVLKSAIEGGVIKKNFVQSMAAPGTSTNDKITREETDEEFLTRWIKWVRRNEKQDRELFLEQVNPF